MNVAELANQALPFITAAIGAYGTAILTKTQDLAAEESVNLGRQLLQRFLTREQGRERIEAAVQDVAEAPEDEDHQAALRGQLKKALAADPDLLKDIVELLKGSDGAAVIGNESSQIVNGGFINGDNIQIGEAGKITFRRR
ncbi:hypothetical protein [Nonomuraea rubra]|uniref:hypothetical protein n=1 Tax=Nonomuraea rubra TaxID=46180 RepID=UPI0033E9B126